MSFDLEDDAHSRRKLGIFVFLVAFLQGSTSSLTPVFLSTFGQTFSLDLQQRGQIQSFVFGGQFLALLISGFVTERIGVRRSAPLATTLAGTGCLLISLARDFTVLRLGALLIGVGMTWGLSCTSATIAAVFYKTRQKMFMWVMLTFALAGSIFPILMGYLVTIVHPWQYAFRGLTVYLWCGALLVYLVFGRSLGQIGLRKTGADDSPTRQVKTGGWTDRIPKSPGEVFRWYRGTLLGQGALLLIGFLITLDNLGTGSLATWTPTLFETRYGSSTTLAGTVVAASTAGCVVGRIFLGTLVVGRWADRVLLGLCFCVGMGFYALLLLIPVYPIGLAMMFLQGFFLSAQAPTVYALTASKFRERAATAVPLADAIGNLGGLVGPPLMGALAQSHGGLERVLWAVPVIGLLLASISLSWEFLERYRDRARPTLNTNY